MQQLVDGQLSYDQLEDAMPQSEDPALAAVLWQLMLWLADEPPERARLILSSAEVNEVLQRTLRFLATSLPFEWPSAPVASFMRATKGIPLARRFVGESGDDSAWPFFRREDLP